MTEVDVNDYEPAPAVDSAGSSRRGGADIQALITPKPSVDYIKGQLTTWPKLVELIIRAVCIVLTFCLFIAACSAVSALAPFAGFGRGANSTAGWLVFVTLITMIVQGVIIAAKLLNFGFMSTYDFAAFIADVVIAGVTTGILFCSAIPAAVYAGDLRTLGFPGSVLSSTGAVAAFAFFDLFAFIALLVWLIVARFFLSKMLNYKKSEGDGPRGGEATISVPEQDL